MLFIFPKFIFIGIPAIYPYYIPGIYIPGIYIPGIYIPAGIYIPDIIPPMIPGIYIPPIIPGIYIAVLGLAILTAFPNGYYILP